MVERLDGMGVLPNHHLEKAIAAGVISAADDEIPRRNIQPASLDLRLGEVAYRIRCSFLPGAQPVEHRLKDLVIDELDLTATAPCSRPTGPTSSRSKERLRAAAGVRGKANPKSSTGRADVFTRVITDDAARFDEIADGYTGGSASRWCRCRSRCGCARTSRSTSCACRSATPRSPTTTSARDHAADAAAVVGGEPRRRRTSWRSSTGLFLGLDLRGRRRRPRRLPRPRTTRRCSTCARSARLDPAPFWEPVRREDGDRIVLEPEQLLPADVRRGGHDPADLAAEMTAYDPTSGELRTHYAGFFDPGFGYDPDGGFAVTRGPRGAGPRRAVHDRARPARLQAHLRAHAGAARRCCTATRHRLATTSARPRPSASTSGWANGEGSRLRGSRGEA